MTTTRCYSELIRLQTFEERFAYLRLDGVVGLETFGFERYLNQVFYRSREWKSVRDTVIIRDCGCNLGVAGQEIPDRIIVHHMNPVSISAIQGQVSELLNPEYLICVDHTTHNAIHYGDETFLIESPVTRCPNDTCLWKLKGGTP